MILKIALINLIFLTISFASFQKVKIGKIDDYYNDKITITQIENIVKEIEQIFESQLGFNVFDYSYDGKPIDILYLPPSQLEKRVKRKLAKLNKNIKKIEDLQDYFPNKKIEVDSLQKEYDLKSKYLNEKISDLNKYVKEANKKKYTKQEYNEVKSYINSRKNDIKKDNSEKKSLERKLRRLVLQYNNKILKFNNLIRQSNYLSTEIESLNRNNKIVKGRTFGQKEITMKTYFKDGKKYKEKNVKNSMNKIEIYNFENINQLKAVIAHEIAHLVGIPHINEKGSLMHPILQKEQVEALYLSKWDLINFKENF